MKPPGTIVTFYSYKGGVGRSMCLAHSAWVLAAQGYKVLVVDWDLEAPGLHRYFAPFINDPTAENTDGLIDFLLQYCDAATSPPSEPTSAGPASGAESSTDWINDYTNLGSYAVEVSAPGISGGCLDLVVAGRNDEAYSRRISLFDWNYFYDKLGGGAFLERVRRRLVSESGYDYVLLDSRTGLSDTAGICTAHLPDAVVTLYTYNYQSIYGAAEVTGSAVRQADLYSKTGAMEARGLATNARVPLRIYPVGSRADSFDPERLQGMRRVAAEQFTALTSHLDPSEKEDYQLAVEIPYKQELSYNEVLSVLDKPTDPKSYLATIYRLVSYLTSAPTANLQLLEISDGDAKAIWRSYAAAPNASHHIQSPPLIRDSAWFDAAIADMLEDARRSALTVLSHLITIKVEEGGTRQAKETSLPVSDFSIDFQSTIRMMINVGLLQRRFDGSAEFVSISNADWLQQSKVLVDLVNNASPAIFWRQSLEELRQQSLRSRGSFEWPRLVRLPTTEPSEGVYPDADLLPAQAQFLAIWSRIDSLRQKTEEDATRLEESRISAARADQLARHRLDKLRLRSYGFLIVAASLAAAALSGLFVVNHFRVTAEIRHAVELKAAQDAAVAAKDDASGQAVLNNELQVRVTKLSSQLDEAQRLLGGGGTPRGLAQLKAGAQENSRAGNFPAADAQWWAVKNVSPIDSDKVLALTKIGNDALQREAYTDAEDAFSATLEIAPFSTEARIGRGHARMYEGKLDLAAEDLQEAYALACNNTGARNEAISFLGSDNIWKTSYITRPTVRIFLPPIAKDPNIALLAKGFGWELGRQIFLQGFFVDSICPVRNDPKLNSITVKTDIAENPYALRQNELLLSIATNWIRSRDLPVTVKSGRLTKSGPHELWFPNAVFAAKRGIVNDRSKSK
jgi:CobQ/CobB/MinD/ParA nucleotide binding domain